MKSIHECIGAGVLVLVGLMSSSAQAEKADRSKPVQVEADSVRVDDIKKQAVYEGDVVLTQGTLMLAGDRMIVRQDGQGFASGEAIGGPVRFRQKMDGRAEYVEGVANRVEYDARTDVVKLIGNAWLKQGEDELRGQLITYNSATEQYQAQGALQGVGQGRVRAVIRPKSQPAAGAPAPGPDGKRPSAP